MRRLAASLAAIVLITLPLTAFASGTESYKDKYTSISWGGSDGSLSWIGPWVEINDDDDEKKGNVRVASSGNCQSGNCLWMAALTTLLGPIGVRRAADTSGFQDLSLRFDLDATPSLLGSELEVQVRSGGSWTTVAEYQLGSGLDVSPTIDVSGHRSASFQVRFSFSGLLLSSEVFVDNIEIYGSTIEPTTTTTTTTTLPTTTTTAPTTTTTGPTTTTTRPPAGPTTTQPEGSPTTSYPGGTTSTTLDTGGAGVDTTTTTSIPTSATPGSGTAETPTTSSSTTSSSTTTVPAGSAGEGGSGGAGQPETSGLRLAARGLQANFQSDLYGDVRGVTYLNGVDFRADYNMAVEIIEASWVWIALLGLVVAYSIISGLDRRRRDSQGGTTPLGPRAGKA